MSRSLSSSNRLALVVSLTVALSGAGCGGASPFLNGPADGGPEQNSRSPDELERGEIEERGSNALTAMSLIRRLRPAWLRARGPNTFNDPSSQFPVVYIDEIRHGSLATLHRIPVGEIYRIEFFGTSDATTRWGTGHLAGVINIVTGREWRR